MLAIRTNLQILFGLYAAGNKNTSTTYKYINSYSDTLDK